MELRKAKNELKEIKFFAGKNLCRSLYFKKKKKFKGLRDTIKVGCTNQLWGREDTVNQLFRKAW